MAIATLAIIGIAIPLKIHGDFSESSKTTFSVGKSLTEAIYAPGSILEQTPTTESLKLALSYYCRKYGGNYYELYRVIQCESGFDYKARNKNSTASGLAQFLNGTWKQFNKTRKTDLDKDNPYDQIEMITWAFANGLQSHWECFKLLNN